METVKGFSRYGAIVEWLKKEYGLDIEYGTVYALVRYRLGAKLKVLVHSYLIETMERSLSVVQQGVNKASILNQ
ncbi:hypothetical protein [Nostoc sp. 'Lobaria pulmonaria (5183) cyanobiont']|uniref:hypothetical protein n=1 Tax=Nostoc sp. 'Lobaria pulmonaria (5183) cyanobiont' TaxID=1618022 RepID=UPI000CF325D2